MAVEFAILGLRIAMVIGLIKTGITLVGGAGIAKVISGEEEIPISARQDKTMAMLLEKAAEIRQTPDHEFDELCLHTNGLLTNITTGEAYSTASVAGHNMKVGKVLKGEDGKPTRPSGFIGAIVGGTAWAMSGESQITLEHSNQETTTVKLSYSKFEQLTKEGIAQHTTLRERELSEVKKAAPAKVAELSASYAALDEAHKKQYEALAKSKSNAIGGELLAHIGINEPSKSNGENLFIGKALVEQGILPFNSLCAFAKGKKDIYQNLNDLQIDPNTLIAQEVDKLEAQKLASNRSANKKIEDNKKENPSFEWDSPLLVGGSSVALAVIGGMKESSVVSFLGLAGVIAAVGTVYINHKNNKDLNAGMGDVLHDISQDPKKLFGADEPSKLAGAGIGK